MIATLAFALSLQSAQLGPVPVFLVKRVVGKATYTMGLDPKEFEVRVPVLPNGAQVAVKSGFVVLRGPGDKQDRILRASSDRIKVAFEPGPTPKFALRYSKLYIVGGSTRRGSGVTLFFPLSGSIRANFPIVALAPGQSWPKGTFPARAEFASKDVWDFGETASVFGMLAEQFKHPDLENVTGHDMQIRFGTGTGALVTDFINILPTAKRLEVENELAEIGEAMDADSCVLRAAVLNDFRLKTEAAIELERAIVLEPDNHAAYWALALIYYEAGQVQEATQVITDLMRRMPLDE